MRTRTATVVAATLCTVTLLAGCGNDATEASKEPTAPAPTSEGAAEEEPSEKSKKKDSPPAPAEEVVITVTDFEYSDPGPVAPGTEITVENTDDTAHTVTADGDGDFDVSVLPGEPQTFTAPDSPGEYPYLCRFHAGMTGTLVVE